MCTIEEENIDLLMKKRYDKIKLESIVELGGKIKVSCIKGHSWITSIKNALTFHLGCYECHKGKSYSMDEIKILKYIQENYIPHDGTFRFAESGGQFVIRPKPPKEIQPEFKPPLYYQCDGFSRKVYSYDKTKRELSTATENFKGTVFEVLGDYHHSNPEYYNPNDISPRKGMLHKENYEYTMNRLKHIEEQGYKVFYIWISDFRRFSWDLERSNVHLFDYMNIEKSYEKKAKRSLLYKGSQRFNDFSLLE